MRSVKGIFGNAAEAKATALAGVLGALCYYTLSGGEPRGALFGAAYGVLIGVNETRKLKGAEPIQQRQP